jgi:DHA2 family multidrug resistance protein-like MFS transporter
VFLRRQRRLADPMINLSLFGDRRFSLGAACILVGFGCAPAVLFLLTQKFQLVSDWSPVEAGLALIPWTLASGLGAVLGAWCAGRWGHRAAIVTGLALFAGSSAALALLRDRPGYLLIGGVLICAGLGLGVALPLAGDNMMSAAQPRTAGQAGAIMQVCYELGAGTGIVVLGTLAGVVYRSQLPAGVPTAAAESLGGARAAAEGLPGDLASALVTAARTAFLSGFAVTTAVVAVLVATVAGVVLALLRRPAGPAGPA